MSLHTLANHLQSAGRGEDKVLVHMTPGEVQGLQSLAMAQGGSLSINPQTGLPEAGILSSLLPMIAGFALGPAGFQLMTAAQAGLTVGALTGVATGSLKKGIMAGLGAYGGAGLGQGLMAQGATAATPSATQTAITNVADDVANFAGKNSNPFSSNQIFNSGSPTLNASAANNSALSGFSNPSVSNPGLSSLAQTNQNILSSIQSAPSVPTAPFTESANRAAAETLAKQNILSSQVPSASSASNYFTPNGFNAGANLGGADKISSAYNGPVSTGGYAQSSVPVSTPTTVSGASSQGISRPFTDNMSQAGRGLSASTKDFEGLKGLYNAMPQGSVIASGITLADALKPEYKDPEKTESLIRPYEFEYNSTNISGDPYSGSAERTYFNPTFTALTPYSAPGPEYKAKGGLASFGIGGAVENMAAQNAIGSNTGYPMADLQTPMYSDPSIQRPQAVNVVAPSVDAGVDAYTGEARFAAGGAPSAKAGRTDGKVWTGTAYVDPNPKGIIGKLLGQDQDQSVKYDYNPQTMQFTQSGTSKTSGGMAQPIMQPQSPSRPLIPSINIPAYQTPEQQLGLTDFYNQMNQQFGQMGGYAKGGVPSLRAAPMNTKMAAIDAAIAKMQTRQGQQEIQQAAMNGDAAAQAALQRTQEKESMNGLKNLGGYSDGGQLLKGPGDGVSDSIPASIGDRQPARLADGEFVVPARIVSELGNGSTDAGARKLYAMMDRVQKARRKTVGKGKVAVNSKSESLLPA